MFPFLLLLVKSEHKSWTHNMSPTTASNEAMTVLINIFKIKEYNC